MPHLWYGSIGVALCAIATAQSALRDCALQVLHPERGEAAMWTLLDAGEAAVAPLLAAYDEVVARPQPDWRLAMEQVRLLGLLGREAVSAVPGLTLRMRQARPVLHEALAWALGETAPYASRVVADAAIGALQENAAEATAAALAKLHFDDDLAAVFADRRVLDATHTPRGIAVAERLRDSIDQLGRLARQVAAARAVAIANWGKLGAAHQRAALAWERVFVAVLPDDPECVYAWGNLLRHPDPRVRLDAVRRLSRFGERAGAVVPQLVSALHDGSLRVARAAALQLGAMGAAAASAEAALAAAVCRPGLERVAEAARAALGRVATRDVSNMTPAARAVHEFMLAAEPERARLALPIVAFGAQALGPLEAAIWEQPFDASRTALRDALFGVLLELGAAAGPALPTMFWWAEQHPQPAAVRGQLTRLVAALGAPALRHHPRALEAIAGWRAWGSVGDDALAAVRSVCAAPEGVLAALLCHHTAVRAVALDVVAGGVAWSDVLEQAVIDVAAQEPSDWDDEARRRVRATAAGLALVRGDIGQSGIAWWHVIARDGDLAQQRQIAEHLVASPRHDRALWRAMAEHDDAEVRALGERRLRAGK